MKAALERIAVALEKIAEKYCWEEKFYKEIAEHQATHDGCWNCKYKDTEPSHIETQCTYCHVENGRPNWEPAK